MFEAQTLKASELPSLKRTEFTMYGQRYTLASLDDDEVAIFEDNFNKLLGCFSSELRRIFLERADTIIAGIMAIKEKLDRRKFRGMNPADMEVGMSLIRPEFVKANNLVINDWNVTLTGMGTWDRWLDRAAGAGFALSEDHGLIITHITSQVTPSPFVRSVHFQIGRINLIPEDVSDIMLGDNENGVAHFPVPTKIALPEDEVLSTITGQPGVEYPKLGGLVVGLGRLLKAETPAW